MARPKLSERVKWDIGLIPQTINNNNVTGDYFDVRGYQKLVAICIDGANAVNKATQVEFIQATAAAGTGAKVVKQSNDSSGTESKAVGTVAATKLTNVTEATVTCSSAANADTLKVNGITFTAHTNTTTASSRQFSIAGTDAQDATELHGLINHATYGVPNVTSVDGGSGTLTLKTTKKGTGTLTLEASDITHTVLAITQQILVAEIDVQDLDLAGGFYWVAVKVTKAGNGIVGAVLARVTNDYPKAQQTAAYTLI